MVQIHNSLTRQQLPGVKETQAARYAVQQFLFAVVLGIVLGGTIGSTFAAWLAGEPWWLGKPFLPPNTTSGIDVYFLMAIITSVVKYHAYSAVVKTAVIAGGITAVIAGAITIIGYRKMIRARDGVLKSDIHGSAHFADKNEIKAASLLPSDDPKADKNHICYVGGWTDPKTGKQIYLQHSGPEHILALAPTRSGKGVGLVIPTLLSWRGSVLVNDIKGENFGITAGWRASIGQRVLKFSPTTPLSSCHFNPLDEIRVGTEHETKDVQNIATMIVDPDGKGLSDHWAKTGFALLVGCILHVLYCREIPNKTLVSVGELLSDPDIDPEAGIDSVFTKMKEYEHDPEGRMSWKKINGEPTKTHPTVAQSAQEMLNKAPNEKSGVISTTMSFLSLYRDPQVASVISKSDFHVTDLMNDEKPISLYLVVPASDKDRLKPLIRLIINQIIRRLTESMDFKNGRAVAHYKHRLLLMIDEFPSLGKLEIFEQALAFIAGYGMKAYLICQDTSQLYKEYSKDESITSNSHVRVYYSTNRHETAEYVSKMLGKRTIVTESNSKSYAGNYMAIQTGSSGGIQYQARDLLTPDEISRLKGPEKNSSGDITQPGDMIVLASGHAPILGTQILYFRDSVFSKRSMIKPPKGGDSFSIPGGFKAELWGVDDADRPTLRESDKIKQQQILDNESRKERYLLENEENHVVKEEGTAEEVKPEVESVNEVSESEQIDVPSADEIAAAVELDIPDFGYDEPKIEVEPEDIVVQQPEANESKQIEVDADILISEAILEADAKISENELAAERKAEGERIAAALKKSEDTIVKPELDRDSIKTIGDLF